MTTKIQGTFQLKASGADTTNPIGREGDLFVVISSQNFFLNEGQEGFALSRLQPLIATDGASCVEDHLDPGVLRVLAVVVDFPTVLLEEQNMFPPCQQSRFEDLGGHTALAGRADDITTVVSDH